MGQMGSAAQQALQAAVGFVRGILKNSKVPTAPESAPIIKEKVLMALGASVLGQQLGHHSNVEFDELLDLSVTQIVHDTQQEKRLEETMKRGLDFSEELERTAVGVDSPSQALSRSSPPGRSSPEAPAGAQESSPPRFTGLTRPGVPRYAARQTALEAMTNPSMGGYMGGDFTPTPTIWERAATLLGGADVESYGALPPPVVVAFITGVRHPSSRNKEGEEEEWESHVRTQSQQRGLERGEDLGLTPAERRAFVKALADSPEMKVIKAGPLKGKISEGAVHDEYKEALGTLLRKWTEFVRTWVGSPGTAAVLKEALGDDPRVRDVFAALEREMLRQGTIPHNVPFLFLTPAERIGVKEGKGGALAELTTSSGLLYASLALSPERGAMADILLAQYLIAAFMHLKDKEGEEPSLRSMLEAAGCKQHQGGAEETEIMIVKVRKALRDARIWHPAATLENKVADLMWPLEPVVPQPGQKWALQKEAHQHLAAGGKGLLEREWLHMMARLHHFLRAQAVSMGGQAKDMGEFKTIEEFLVWVSDLLTASVDIYAMLEKCFGEAGGRKPKAESPKCTHCSSRTHTALTCYSRCKECKGKDFCQTLKALQIKEGGTGSQLGHMRRIKDKDKEKTEEREQAAATAAPANSTQSEGGGGGGGGGSKPKPKENPTRTRCTVCNKDTPDHPVWLCPLRYDAKGGKK